jgi:uncharacterized membrane protein YgaE (UPF0421/DUF939 family)
VKSLLLCFFWLLQPDAATREFPVALGPWGSFGLIAGWLISLAFNAWFMFRSKTTDELRKTVDLIKEQAAVTEKELAVYRGKAERLERENSEQKSRISMLEAKTDITGVMASLTQVMSLLNDQIELSRKWDREHATTQSAVTQMLDRLMNMERDDHQSIAQTIRETGEAVVAMQAEIKELVRSMRQNQAGAGG